jgi:hypothetical protein
MSAYDTICACGHWHDWTLSGRDELTTEQDCWVDECPCQVWHAEY